MDALLFRAPRLGWIWTQLDIESARRIIHKAGADTDEAPLERRLAGALHINAEPALLCEARFERWRCRLVLLHDCSLEHAGRYSLRTMMCFATV